MVGLFVYNVIHVLYLGSEFEYNDSTEYHA